MFYPEDIYLDKWNLLITIVLLFTSIVTPARIAFVQDEDTEVWLIINILVDLLFTIDITVVFNSAFYTEDFQITDDRKEIASQYITSWFIIDVFSVIPFDLFFMSHNGNINSMVKFARIGRLYKLIKLTRLVKMLKLVKDRSKIIKQINDIFKIGVGFERLFFFIFLFLILSHIVSCLWVITANFEEDLN